MKKDFGERGTGDSIRVTESSYFAQNFPTFSTDRFGFWKHLSYGQTGSLFQSLVTLAVMNLKQDRS